MAWTSPGLENQDTSKVCFTEKRVHTYNVQCMFGKVMCLKMCHIRNTMFIDSESSTTQHTYNDADVTESGQREHNSTHGNVLYTVRMFRSIAGVLR